MACLVHRRRHALYQHVRSSTDHVWDLLNPAHIPVTRRV